MEAGSSVSCWGEVLRCCRSYRQSADSAYHWTLLQCSWKGFCFCCQSKSKEVGSVRYLRTSELLERRRLLVVPALAKHGILINFPTSSRTYAHSPLCKRRQHGLIKMQVHCQCESCWRCIYSDPGVLIKDHYTRRVHGRKLESESYM